MRSIAQSSCQTSIEQTITELGARGFANPIGLLFMGWCNVALPCEGQTSAGRSESHQGAGRRGGVRLFQGGADGRLAKSKMPSCRAKGWTGRSRFRRGGAMSWPRPSRRRATAPARAIGRCSNSSAPCTGCRAKNWPSLPQRCTHCADEPLSGAGGGGDCGGSLSGRQALNPIGLCAHGPGAIAVVPERQDARNRP